MELTISYNPGKVGGGGGINPPPNPKPHFVRARRRGM